LRIACIAYGVAGVWPASQIVERITPETSLMARPFVPNAYP